MTSSQSFSVKSSKAARRMMPALLTRISMPPSSLTVVVGDELRRGAFEEIGVNLASAAAQGAHLLGRLVGAQECDQREIGAGFGEADCRALAQAAAGASYERHFPVSLN